MPWTDEELVAKSISGDADSFNELVVRGSWDILFYGVPRKTSPRFYCDRSTCTVTDRSAKFSPSFDTQPGRGGAVTITPL